MAKFTFKGIDEYSERLAKLGTASEGVCKYAVYEGAAIIADAIKEKIPVDTGDLRDSMILTDMKNDNGFVYTQISFVGYDNKGVPNAIKAAVLESGSSKQSKRPFIRPAMNSAKSSAEAAMAAALDKKLEEYMNK